MRTRHPVHGVPGGLVPKAPPRPVFKAPPVHVPKRPPAGQVPRPRRLRLVRDADAPALLDLFELFPDLPRPSWFNLRLPLRARRLAFQPDPHFPRAS